MPRYTRMAMFLTDMGSLTMTSPTLLFRVQCLATKNPRPVAKPISCLMSNTRTIGSASTLSACLTLCGVESEIWRLEIRHVCLLIVLALGQAHDAQGDLRNGKIATGPFTHTVRDRTSDLCMSSQLGDVASKCGMKPRKWWFVRAIL